MSRPLVDLELVEHMETEKAWLVSEDGDSESAVWIPKSQVERDARVIRLVGLREVHEFTMPEWLATEKGLV